MLLYYWVFIRYSTGEMLASLEESFWRPTIPAVNIQEEEEASVVSLCTH